MRARTDEAVPTKGMLPQIISIVLVAAATVVLSSIASFSFLGTSPKPFTRSSSDGNSVELNSTRSGPAPFTGSNAALVLKGQPRQNRVLSRLRRVTRPFRPRSLRAPPERQPDLLQKRPRPRPMAGWVHLLSQCRQPTSRQPQQIHRVSPGRPHRPPMRSSRINPWSAIRPTYPRVTTRPPKARRTGTIPRIRSALSGTASRKNAGR